MGSPSAFNSGKAVNEPIEANFSFPSPVCEDIQVNFGNISGIGCDGNTLESG